MVLVSAVFRTILYRIIGAFLLVLPAGIVVIRQGYRVSEGILQTLTHLKMSKNQKSETPEISTACHLNFSPMKELEKWIDHIGRLLSKRYEQLDAVLKRLDREKKMNKI